MTYDAHVDAEDVVTVLAALDQEGVRYAVIGAIALALHGLDRATRDLDLFVDPSADNVARLRQALRRVFDDPALDELTADDLAGEYPVVQYGPPDETFTIDIVSRLGDAFSFSDLEIMELEVEGVRVQVATPRMLYRMKRGTVRPHDRLDAERLRHHFDLEEG